MTKIELTKIYDSLNSIDELVAILHSHPSLEIELPFDSINVARSSIDIILDYLSVSFLAERIAKHAEIVNSKRVKRDKYYLGFLINIKPTNKDELAKLIYHYSKWYSNIEEPSSEEFMDHSDELSEYESSLEDHKLEFPNLIDDYYANLINAAYYEIASESDDEESFFKEEYKKYPEREYGYWRSASCNKLKTIFYTSIDGWIIPSSSDFEEILKVYSGIEQTIEFEEANFHIHKGKEIIISNTNAVWYTIKGKLEKARDCSTKAINNHKNSKKSTKSKFLLSQYGDVLVIKETNFSYVFFLDNVKLNFNELNEIRVNIGRVQKSINNITGISKNIKLDWSKFDDETFEQLCYDIIYYHPKFDNSTIRKMGKSRSRDGGRDITVWTKEFPGHEPVLFIFQCKFYKRYTSFSRTKIGDAGSTILHYGAKGYGVFTTGVIDATLYDMLDGFAKNNDMSTRENWSIYELERLLARYTDLYDRHFK